MIEYVRSFQQLLDYFLSMIDEFSHLFSTIRYFLNIPLDFIKINSKFVHRKAIIIDKLLNNLIILKLFMI